MPTKQEPEKLNPNLPSNVTPFPYPYYPAATEDDTIDLVELILTVWRYWWLILASVVLCLGAAAVFLQITPKSYNTSVIYEISNVPGVNKAEINGKLSGLFGSRAFLMNFLDRTGLTPLILRDLYDPSTDT
ncbi:MAG: Wzz/FepE/Etk N-terminal domain-containing protein, partial [Deltaproteobacteria bacterium]